MKKRYAHLLIFVIPLFGLMECSRPGGKCIDDITVEFPWIIAHQCGTGIYYQVGAERPFTGTMTSTFPNGQLRAKGAFSEGIPLAVTLWYRNGAVRREISYGDRGDIEQQTLWFSNGRIMEHTVEGVEKSYYRDGTRKHLWDGNRYIRYYPNGNRRMISRYEQVDSFGSRRPVLRKGWYRSGRLRGTISYNYTGGAPRVHWVEYDSTGIVKLDTVYSDMSW